MHTTDYEGKLKLLVDDESKDYELHALVHEEIDLDDDDSVEEAE